LLSDQNYLSLMSKFKYFTYAISAMLVIFAGCRENKNEKKQADAPQAAVTVAAPVIGNESLLLLKDLEQNGDYVNSQFFPSLIKATVVNNELGPKNLIIDLRTPELFSKGHIEGAVNKQFSDLPEYFQTGIKPFEFDKIILVCDDGQMSSYTTSLLRLMGYGNVYALRWGMSGWNKSYAQNGWMKSVSGKYENQLEVTVNEASQSSSMPEINTGLKTGKEVGDERFKKLFKDGTGNILITAEEVFKDPSKFFIINLERKDKYDDGHIPGAVRYKPESTLGFTDVMSTIPFDRTVVVYCGTGHNSGFATAYLRLFGYDARTLRYGNNSFMYDKMVSQKAVLSWLPFTLAESNDFKIVK
jgi:rhodanese-related sulfurtransferase